MQKRAYTAMMTYVVSDQEKQQAEKAIRWFTYCLKMLDQCQEHLNLIYNPFKKQPDISTDDVFARRAMLRIYRDKVIDNFNQFKRIAFKSYAIIQPFSSDTQMDKISSAFVESVEDIETQVNRFVDLFDDLKSEEFSKGVIAAIEHIKKEIAQLEQLVNDRVKTYLQTNILARNWVDGISTELQEKVEKKSPLVMQLVEERLKYKDGQ